MPRFKGILAALTARTAAKIAEDNGWTFIMLNRVEGLSEALRFAERYQPAVLFAEDIDRVLDERDDKANELINQIDGLISKTAEVITVLTSNHADKIQPVMLRPGRLDAVIPIMPPDEVSVVRLVNLYVNDMLEPGTDLAPVGRELAGQIPATIREVVERSKLAMIARDAETISAWDLIVSARGMTEHLALLNRDLPEPTAGERLALALRDVISAPSEKLQEIGQTVSTAKQENRQLHDRTTGLLKLKTGELAEQAEVKKNEVVHEVRRLGSAVLGVGAPKMPTISTGTKAS